MRLTNFSKILPGLPWAILAPFLLAQSDALLTVAPPAKIAGKPDSQATARLSVQLKSGYHVNSNAPNDEYLIPLRLNWESGALQAVEVIYPKPRAEKYDFSAKPLSVFTGDFEILTRFKIPAAARKGPGILAGKLRYQACNNTTCFPPKTVEIRLPYEIQ